MLFSPKSPVVQLTDKDIKLNANGVSFTHSKLKGKDGYLMVYAEWCPHCQAKKDMWEHLAREFNNNPAYKKENFVIAAMDSDDPMCQGTCSNLGISGIPRFFHLINRKNDKNKHDLVDYKGAPTIESFLQQACSLSQHNRTCSTKLI